MEILILLLASPLISAQRYWKHADPNDEPFLPIHPLYPYNPKLAKRGSDKDIDVHLKPELFAPRPDARDSYTASYNADLPKDSFFPGLATYKRNPPIYPPYPGYFSPYSHGNQAYIPGNSFGIGQTYVPNSPYPDGSSYHTYDNPYASNGYSASPYLSHGSHSPGPYPGFYHPSYFYPDYYNGPQPVLGPRSTERGPYPPPFPGPKPPSGENGKANEDNAAKNQEKTTQKMKKENEQRQESENRYVDGSNLISQSSPMKDLTMQSSGKTSELYNQYEQLGYLHPRTIQIPRTTYKVISVGGQPVGPDYPLPSSYARVQLLEQIAAVQKLAKSLGHSTLPRQNEPTPEISYERFTTMQAGLPGVENHGAFYNDARASGSPVKLNGEQSFVTNSNVGRETTTGQLYTDVEEDLRSKTGGPRLFATSQRTPGKSNEPRLLYGSPLSSGRNAPVAGYAHNQSEKSIDGIDQLVTSFSKIPVKYSEFPYTTKSTTKLPYDQGQPLPLVQDPKTSSLPRFEEAAAAAAAAPSQIGTYEPTALAQNSPYRSEPKYNGPDQPPAVSYHNQNVAHVTPSRAYTYHYLNAQPLTRPTEQHTKTNLEDVNFGTKQGNRG